MIDDEKMKVMDARFTVTMRRLKFKGYRLKIEMINYHQFTGKNNTVYQLKYMNSNIFNP